MHKCTKCGKEYEIEELANLKGCSCGSTLFVFTKNKNINKIELDEHKIEEIERKIKSSQNDISDTADVKVLDNGIFTINIEALLKNKPVVIEGEEGVYFIKFNK